MAASDRQAVHPLIRELERRPRLFSFFAATALLEQAAGASAPLGGPGPAREEAVRLRPSSSLGFPSADVVKIERRDGDGPPYRLTTTILGLYGSTSPLPSFYSEEILQREMGEPDDPARLLLDVLNHRLLSLLYRAWAKYRWPSMFRSGAVDPISQNVSGLLGLRTDALQSAPGIPLARLLPYAGVASQRPRCAISIAGVISDYFDGIPVSIEQCVARWVPIPSEDRSRLGGHNARLGVDLTVGARILDRAGKVRIRVGPVDREAYEAFLPNGSWARPLTALARYLLPDTLEHDVELVIRGEAVTGVRLSNGPDAARLGWTSWLGLKPGRPDDAEVFPPVPISQAA